MHHIPFVVISAQKLYYKHLTTADGLPHNLCYHVNQAQDGTIWVCTDDGIARYERGNFTRYGKENGFPSNYPIMAVTTNQGNQLVAMWKKGIYEFDGEKAWKVAPLDSNLNQNLNMAFISDSLIRLFIHFFEIVLQFKTSKKGENRHSTATVVWRVGDETGVGGGLWRWHGWSVSIFWAPFF
jgi:ligand-binding sensor domain-containing protein